MSLPRLINRKRKSLRRKSRRVIERPRAVCLAAFQVVYPVEYREVWETTNRRHLRLRGQHELRVRRNEAQGLNERRRLPL
jgi:hypothetical protein